METEAEVGYQDAIRQVQRTLNRRLKTLQDELEGADSPEKAAELKHRYSEVQHLLEVMHSLHR